MESQATDVESHVDSDHLLLDTPSSSSIWFEQKLNEEVGRLGIALAVLGLDQSTRPTLITSWLVFSVLGIVVPLVSVWVDACTECTKIEVRKFEKLVQISESALTAVSLLCFAHNFRKYGLRRFLFLDQIDEEMLLQQSYQKQIHVCAAVELLGVVLCLRAAARMTHRGQSIASIASKWHALATCNLSSVSSDGQSSTVNVDQPHPMLSAEYDSDLEPSEDLNLPSASQLAPYMTSYHKRQALGKLCL